MAKILVVEDERVAAQSIRDFLENSEHTIVSMVESGVEAVQAATAVNPDLVLMDICLKGKVDGIAAAAQISQQLDIPVIYLTANTENQTLQRAIATEPFGYLIKPFNPVELSTAITIALHRHRHEKYSARDAKEGDRVLSPSLDRAQDSDTTSAATSAATSDAATSDTTTNIGDPARQPAIDAFAMSQELSSRSAHAALPGIPLQTERAALLEVVNQRTIMLQRALSFEALLKRITDKVRDSLDEHQIVQAAVEELGLGLEVECCSAALFNADQTIASVTYEYTTSMPSACGKILVLSEQPDIEIYQQLLNGQSLQFCYTIENPLRPTTENHAILACPIIDDQGVLGDLWLFRPSQDYFSDIDHRLVAQVANQCAIALRQSRLFQAVQAQVNELQRLNDLKNNFLSTISHELRTPISNIKMAIQMLEIVLHPSGVLHPETGVASRYFKILQTECQQEIALIDDLLNLSRLDAGTEPLILSTIDPSIWISHAVEPFLDRIKTTQQQLILNLPAKLPALVTDLSCLGRILSELMDNACKYTPSGEKIVVSACLAEKPTAPAVKGLDGQPNPEGRFNIQNTPLKTAHSKFLQISVANSGNVLSPEELPRIFDTFYRVPNNDPWRYSGTGLGLALVKKLAAHLGVSIQVESGNNQTIFMLMFPVSA
jgi:signal transduction histidine kinase/DNA-binding response OmpR family regulator